MANVIFFYIFCLFVLPYEIREKSFEGTLPIAPRCFEKSVRPPAEEKIGPPPLGFWSSPTYDKSKNLWLKLEKSTLLGPQSAEFKKPYQRPLHLGTSNQGIWQKSRFLAKIKENGQLSRFLAKPDEEGPVLFTGK